MSLFTSTLPCVCVCVCVCGQLSGSLYLLNKLMTVVPVPHQLQCFEDVKTNEFIKKISPLCGFGTLSWSV